MMTALPPPDVDSIKFSSLGDRAALRGFECGEREIDRNIEKCCDWSARHRARIFCAHMDGVPEAYAFYAIGVSASDAKYLDKDIVEANDDRAFIPFIYVHYFAVRQEFQNRKVGTMLLGDMLTRCGGVVRNVGVFGMALHALTDKAARLYNKWGFRQRSEARYPLMILPTQSLIDLTKADYPV